RGREAHRRAAPPPVREAVPVHEAVRPTLPSGEAGHQTVHAPEPVREPVRSTAPVRESVHPAVRPAAASVCQPVHTAVRAPSGSGSPGGDAPDGPAGLEADEGRAPELPLGDLEVRRTSECIVRVALPAEPEEKLALRLPGDPEP